mgnify:CR=1 FL=1
MKAVRLSPMAEMARPVPQVHEAGPEWRHCIARFRPQIQANLYERPEASNAVGRNVSPSPRFLHSLA